MNIARKEKILKCLHGIQTPEIEKLGESEERKLIFRYDEYLVRNTNERSSNTNLGLKKSGLKIHVW